MIKDRLNWILLKIHIILKEQFYKNILDKDVVKTRKNYVNPKNVDKKKKRNKIKAKGAICTIIWRMKLYGN